MSSPRVAVAAGSRLGAVAAANVARAGGNAVDACLASAVMGWVAEPFFASMGGSAFIAIRDPEGTTEVIDGNNAMPLQLNGEPGGGVRRTHFPEYADGMHTGIGGGSVAVPGALAAVHRAWERHGKIEWGALFADAIDAARSGIHFPKTSAYYLSTTWEPLWSLFPASRSLFSIDARPLEEGDRLVQSELAESLEVVAERGAQVFFDGELGATVVGEIARDGGHVTAADLRAYEAKIRAPIAGDAFGWRIESNPPPAVGGAVLAHMLALLEGTDLHDPVARLRALVNAQRTAVGYRRERYQDPTGIASAFEETIAGIVRSTRSPSTTHSSAASADGYACSLTESNGYGSGLVAAGVLLNNTLGEEELNPLGMHLLAPGSRCHSNMAPTIATGSGRTVALGSPGADRIVTAIAQTLMRIAVDGADLQSAVAAPRAHLDPRPAGETLSYEPGLPGDEIGFIPRPYDDVHMYFGAVQAAAVAADGTVDAAHDPRRSGDSALV